MIDEQQFLLALDTNPSDTTILGDWADWLEEHGSNNRAAAVRFILKRGLKPHAHGSGPNYVWASQKNSCVPEHARLPGLIWLIMTGSVAGHITYSQISVAYCQLVDAVVVLADTVRDLQVYPLQRTGLC